MLVEKLYAGLIVLWLMSPFVMAIWIIRIKIGMKKIDDNKIH